LFIAVAILVNTTKSQVLFNGENNNIEEYNKLGWEVPEQVNNTGNEKLIISGKYSFETKPVNTGKYSDLFIKSPWLTKGVGTVKINARLNGSEAQDRYVVFQYALYDERSKYQDLTTDFITFDKYAFTDMNSTKTVNIVTSLPEEIKKSSIPYKIRISFVGGEGEGTIIFDDVEVSGTYSSDPSNKYQPVQISEEKAKEDEDKDKVTNKDDDYPVVETKAFNHFYPEKGNGTIMFEDLWPSKGDYDFNDLVVGYRFNIISDADNNIVEIDFEVTPRAIGAGYNNGFGFMLDNIAYNKIYAVEGLKTEAKWLSLNENGTEADQKVATIIPIASASDFLKGPGGSTGVNVDPKVEYIKPQTIYFSVKFRDENGKAPNGLVSMLDFSPENFNPFAIINQNRENEIHLPGYEPSAKADQKIFGTFDDNSSEGNYYKSKDNLPWALNIPAEIPYSTEKVDFIKSYPKFADWAGSKGEKYQDWYEDIEGYRNNEAIYNVK
ncbi:MAG: LruC domain-containing protein, partial [Bacteroidota bacterium]